MKMKTPCLLPPPAPPSARWPVLVVVLSTLGLVLVASFMFRFFLAELCVEAALASLPTTSPTPPGPAVEGVEVWVEISNENQVRVEDQPVELPALAARFEQLQKAAHPLPLRVTLQAAEQSRYGVVTEILDVLGKAKIKGVTFTVGGEEEF